MNDLAQAIAELRRVTPPNSPWEAGDIGVGSSPVDYHIATILNAAASGDLIPKADADLAVALMVEPLLKLREGIEADIRSAHHGRGNGSSSAMREDDRDFRAAVAAAFDALAPDAGTAALAELQVLRDERDALATKNAAIEKRLRERREMHRVNSVLQNSAVIRARLAGPTPFDAVTIADLEELFTDAASRAEAAEAELATLRAQVERLTGAADRLRKMHQMSLRTADYHNINCQCPRCIDDEIVAALTAYEHGRATLTEGAALEAHEKTLPTDQG